MLNALMKIFGKKEPSGKVARDRLKVVLIHDRASVSPEIMEHLKHDILEVVARYLDIRPQEMNITLADDEDSVALVANIPVTNMRHGGKH
ncbi:cell division topological specificity factor MinE [Selenomonas bovis]|uniref:Cell division topological specificity factor n=1 Tax=Selenomonas bovis TaxID=416586 RepID=A0A848B643_9FIRM|nr:cell division topological specificity factor MinE [Selenomonas bovis]MBQ1621177.1 cell division topological specificity factor MinE [Selenomonas sp.]MCI6171186.1 cell division topological specificity factor MinE [Selenomonas bovis]MCI7056558.1 cell division topological specificity factor MinE [Selenomonas bovis]NMD98946.1 cell division topological specificity factor MinE [Selenomonas bovis]